MRQTLLLAVMRSAVFLQAVHRCEPVLQTLLFLCQSCSKAFPTVAAKADAVRKAERRVHGKCCVDSCHQPKVLQCKRQSVR